MSKIKEVRARKILNSKGSFTVEVTLGTRKGEFVASCPSGVSTGKYEAVEVDNAAEIVNEVIAPRLKGVSCRNQRAIDGMLNNLDGTTNKSRLGVNAILPVSMAVCKAGAAHRRIEVWEYIARLAKNKRLMMPHPFILMIEGGVHGGGRIGIQEFMISLEGPSFERNIDDGVALYNDIKREIGRVYGEEFTNVGFEGGLAGLPASSREVLAMLSRSIERAGMGGKAHIVLDVAASEMRDNDYYEFEGGRISTEGMLDIYEEYIDTFPIMGIEDHFDQDDDRGWKMTMKMLKEKKSNILVIGDDLTVSNGYRMKEVANKGLCNAVVIKPNQVGTVTETILSAKFAKSRGWKIVAKHRGGETNDSFVADLAVGIGAEYVAFGAPVRGERVAKYNRLLAIDREI